ncbi:MAG: FUSC family protein [Methanobacterium sp.]
MLKKDSDEVIKGDLSSDENTKHKISRRDYIHRLLFPNNIKPNWNASLYLFAALIVVLILSQLLKLGNLSVAFIISGVLISQLVILNLPIRILTRFNIITAIIISLAFFTAALGLISDWIALVFLLVWVFLSSSLNILGKIQGSLGYIGLIVYFIATLAIANSQSPAIQWGIWALLGALITSFVLLIPKLLRQDKTTLKIVASCFIPNANVNTLIKAKTIIEKSHPTPKISSLMELSRILITTKTLTSTIESNLEGEAKEILKEFHKEINQLSAEVANQILTDDKNPNLNLTNLSKKINEMEGLTGLNEYTRSNILKNMNKFQEIFENSQKILKGVLILDIPPLSLPSKMSTRENLKANFNLHNMYIRHAIRFSFAVGVAFILTLVTTSHNVYWIALTIFVVLQPDISSTFDKMIIRIGATTIGIIVAVIISGILISLGLQIIIYGFIVLLLAVMVAYYRVSYLYYLIALSMIIIFLQPSADILATGLARFADIIVGSVIAFVVGYLILPSKLKLNLPQQVIKRLESNLNYIHFATNPELDTSVNKKKTNLALQGMILSHNNLEAGIDKVINSFDDAEEDIKVLNLIADANDQLSRDLSASVNRINTSKDTHHIWEPTTVKMEQILTDLKNTVENGTDPQPLPDSGLISAEIEEMKIKSEYEDSKVVFEYFKWIISDITSLYDSIKQANDNGTFKRYKNL